MFIISIASVRTFEYEIKIEKVNDWGAFSLSTIRSYKVYAAEPFINFN